MENKVLKKIIIFVTVFMLVFSNCGYTLQALAATDGITLFGFNLFGSGNIDFDVYFLDENGKKQTNNTADVNSEMTMVLELNPKAAGYLKSGTIKAVSEEEGDVNFEFKSAIVDNSSELQSLTINKQADTALLQSELTVEAENEVTEESSVEAETNTTVENQNTVEENKVAEEAAIAENTEENVVEEPVADDTKVTSETTTEIEEEFVDEEAALTEETSEETVLSGNLANATVKSENEIEIENVIENTKVYVNIAFKTGKKLNIEDLYKEIKLEFDGTYINVDLEEIPITLSESVKVGWSYSKDIEATSEYTKVSPFKIGETEGTIVEDTITVKRDITEDFYLPLKQTVITLEAPIVDGEKPADLDVSALKLKATTGEDINEAVLSKDNWYYDSNKNTLTIKVENTNGTFTYGEDVYVVTYRYDTYVSEKEVTLETKGKVEVTEYSAKDNKIEKDLANTEKVVANVGELITYSIGTTEEKIGKGKINANYNQAEERYESEFDTTVNVNILTNDVLNEFTLKDTKEFYVDKDGVEFETKDVKYKKIKFRYSEIEEFLANDGIIEVKNNNGELLYTLNKDLVKSDESAEISIQGDVRGIEISFKNITVNGNITIELTKAIGKSSFDKSAFASFKKLESRINAVVKYSEDSDGTDLVEIQTSKDFEESKTEAEISMNKLSLSTTEVNENVEFKIELNNHKEDSDLYVNPIFEIALPKYVSNIDLKAINMLYESGLSIGNSTIYRAEDGSLRMRIEVNGTQTEFSDGEITNGTNIIVNANITVDQYTPRKDDQVKLYYINSGVTNYTSQTKWTLGVNVPSGIIKTTNGFDSYVFKFNAPSGFITINEIQNYDGENGLVTSIKQGEETREVPMEKGAQVARMNLIAINNTENQCTDVTFLGRIPAKGVTNVKTGEALETNIDVAMLSRITENEDNPISAKIYYSANPDADKNLNVSSNGWTDNPSELSGVKSFLIVPDSTVEPGYIFRYTYEFIIPENLPYEAKIYGSFGAFYNNHSDVAINYESTGADLVGLVTKAGPKVEATLTVNVGDGAEVPEASFLDYTLTVVNSGSVAAEGITVTNPIPTATKVYYENKYNELGNYGWTVDLNQDTKVWTIDKLEPGEVQTFTYTLKTEKSPTMEEIYGAEIKQDENGYYYEIKEVNENSEVIEDNHSGEHEEHETSYKEVVVKKYVEYFDMYTIKNKATIHVDNLALDIESNETKNKLTKSSFDINTYSKASFEVPVKSNFEFAAEIVNISDEDLNNITLVYKMPEELQFTSYAANFVSGESDLSTATYAYDSDSNVFVLKIPEWKNDDSFIITIFANVISGNNEKVSNVLNLVKEDGETESSKPLEMLFKGPKLEATQVVSTNDNTIKEGEKVEFIVSIQNNGNGVAENTSLYSAISQNLKEVTVNTSGSSSGRIGLSKSNELVSTITSIPEGECLNVHISGTAVDVDDDNQTISSKMLVSNPNAEDVNTNEIVLQILNDPTRQVEEPVAKNDNSIVNPNSSDNEDDSKDEVNKTSEGSNSSNDGQNNNQATNNDGTNSQNRNENNNNYNNNNNNNQNNQQSNENVEENNEHTHDEQEEQAAPTYEISGRIWLDKNRNGILDDDESGISGIQVQLQKDNISVKATVSPKDGSYTFRDVNQGKYTIIYTYNKNLYTPTVYKNVEAGITKASFARDINDGKAITDAITVGNGNVENINLGLQEKDNFDLSISKNITLVNVTTNGKTTEHKYENLDLAKLEISAKDLAKTTLELHYQIVVKNEGNVSGKAMQIVDYLPKDTSLNTEKSINWYLGSDGNAYNDSLSELQIAPGEERVLTIVLNKTMTAENTGVLGNKVVITKEDGTTTTSENITNNNATQELIVSVRTGYTASTIVYIILVVALIAIIYLQKTEKIKIDFKKFKIKRIYK